MLWHRTLPSRAPAQSVPRGVTAQRRAEGPEPCAPLRPGLIHKSRWPSRFAGAPASGKKEWFERRVPAVRHDLRSSFIEVDAVGEIRWQKPCIEVYDEDRRLRRAVLRTPHGNVGVERDDGGLALGRVLRN